MNRFIERAIILTSICTLGWTTILIAGVQAEPSNIKEQLEKSDEISSAEKERSTAKIATIAKPKPAAEAIALIKEFEGFESQAYIDTNGMPVIGYGLSQIAGQPVRVGDRISPQQADLALKAHLQEIYRELDRIIRVRLSDRQLSAIASIAFNVGINSIERSTLVKKVNAKDYHGAANEFLRWNKANVRGRLVQLPGLTRRRQAERELFLERT